MGKKARKAIHPGEEAPAAAGSDDEEYDEEADMEAAALAE
jgi:hypothetical protein